MSNTYGTLGQVQSQQADALNQPNHSNEMLNNHHSQDDIEIEVGTIFVSQDNATAVDVIRFFQVIENLKSKVIVREIHQLTSSSNEFSKCTPLAHLFISEPITMDLILDSIYQNGKKFASKLHYTELDLGLDKKIKIYDIMTYKSIL